ncbi:hypothetical protein L2E82_02684 [Cichorium intybus]|uniref:Uncharacterized protein n=1 Tax=Cichorium intybus TaxID=13427 RepID=A0ACB9H3F6_CICIN|nr:hypothetical protein L2E82_02684 [Cichorium intybus]
MYTSSSSSATSVGNKNFNGSEKARKTINIENKKETYGHEDFLTCEIVWAKCSNRFRAWLAIMIEATQKALHQTNSIPDDFRKAIEEAYVIENGNLNSYGDKQESSTSFYFDSDSDVDSESDSDSGLVEIEVETAISKMGADEING